MCQALGSLTACVLVTDSMPWIIMITNIFSSRPWVIKPPLVNNVLLLVGSWYPAFHVIDGGKRGRGLNEPRTAYAIEGGIGVKGALVPRTAFVTKKTL